MDHIAIKNGQTIPFASIPVLEYGKLLEHNIALLADERRHCVNYFGFLQREKVQLLCCIADDAEGTILVSSAQVEKSRTLPSFSAHCPAFHKFEREIHENFGVRYTDHPWLKPVRFPFNREDRQSVVANYPFFRIDSEELHEVGVGPIHAGVIEPGHFRFICNGEQILHLEIRSVFSIAG